MTVHAKIVPALLSDPPAVSPAAAAAAAVCGELRFLLDGLWAARLGVTGLRGPLCRGAPASWGRRWSTAKPTMLLMRAWAKAAEMRMSVLLGSYWRLAWEAAWTKAR